MNYKTSDGIFANITSIYGSSVIVVRLSGEFERIEKALESLSVDVQKLIHRQCLLCKLTVDGKFLDESLITYFKAPHSFTGEDVIEIAIHGSRFIFEELSKALMQSGFRFATNGEFSYRAFLNGKMDLVEAEGMAGLIASETSIQHQVSVRRFNGEDSKTFENLKNTILKALSNLEGIIDFSDEELPPSVAHELCMEVESAKNQIQSYLHNNSLIALKDGIKLAIIGKPNVGKSSIFNMLCGKEKAIVSSFAGTTRDIIEEKMIIKGVPVIIHDTAGIRKNISDEVEIEGIKRAINLLNKTDIKLIISDGEDFKKIAQDLEVKIDENTILVQNKIDLGGVVLKDGILVSAFQKTGFEALLKCLEKKIETNFLPLINSAIYSNERERMLLENAHTFLCMFSLEKEIELASEDLRCSANALSSIIGRIDVEDILGNIFSKFCIGK